MTRSEAVKEWRRRTKERIIKSLGTQCVCCNYNIHEGLDIHHLDPSKKEFTFGSVRANPKNWLSLVEELRKCVLVCANCHREIHAGIRTVPENAVRFNESFVIYKEKRELDPCPICGKPKPNTNITCSNLCASKVRYKVDWNNEELKRLIEVEKLSYVALGLRFNCSDNAVKKHYKRYC